MWCKSGPKYYLCLLLYGPPETEFRINISHCNSSGDSCMKRLSERANKKRRKKLPFSVSFLDWYNSTLCTGHILYCQHIQLYHLALKTLNLIVREKLGDLQDLKQSERQMLKIFLHVDVDESRLILERISFCKLDILQGRPMLENACR